LKGEYREIFGFIFGKSAQPASMEAKAIFFRIRKDVLKNTYNSDG
jgi:hypothetical protein